MMKRKFILFILLSFMISGLFAQTYEECDFFIRSNFNSECLMTTYKDPSDPNYLHDESECIIACAGSNVTYYAENLPDDFECEWEVAGTDDFTVNSSTNSVLVHWPDEITVGNVVLTATGPDNTICIKELCVELIERPVAGIISNPVETGYESGCQYINVCDGQEIQFFSNSTGSAEAPIVGYLWATTFNSWSTENLMFTADYNIYGENTKLTLTVVNECGCKHTVLYYIHINKYPSLKVDCYGSVCENSEVTYTVSNQECDEYYWLVEGGDIVDGQQTQSVSVQWNDITDGYGYLALDGQHCHGDVCPFITYLPIPVLTDTALISGPDIVCVGDIVYYELPQWASTEYTWFLNPTTGAEILFSGHPHQYMIQFNEAGTYTLKAYYNNEFLGCSGIALPFEIEVLKEFLIESEPDACAGETLDFESSMGTFENYVWTILDGDMNLVYSNTAPTISYTFPSAGSYTIIAENDNYCKSVQTSVIIHELPAIPQPDNVDWITEVCPNAGYMFSAEPDDEQYYLHWEAICGNPQEFDGPEFNLTIGDPICNIQIMHIDKITGCISEPFIHELVEFEPAPIIWDNYEVCANEIISISIPQEEGILYEWSITQGHLASIVDGQYTTEIEIQANAIANDFDFVLTRTYCDQFITEIIPVHIKPFVTPDFLLQKKICQFETIDLIPSDNTSIIGTWTWEIEGNTFSVFGTADDALFSYTFNNPGIIPVRLSFIADGCSQVYEVVNTILVNPAPNISVSFSEISPTQIELNATIQDGELGDYFYEWSTGHTDPVITIDNPTESNYFCTVTNLDTECVASDEVELPDEPTGCQTDEGNITYTLDCNTGIFNRTGYNALFEIYWSFTQNSSNPDFTTSGTNNESCNVEFSNAGYYLVDAYQVYDECEYLAEIEIVVPLIPEILVNYYCAGSTDIELELINNSDYMTLVTINQENWYIDGLLTTDLNPIVSSGTHQIGLEITYTYEGTQYTCSVEKEVAYNRGIADFTISDEPYCSGSPIQFTDNSANAISWRWMFNNPMQINLSQNPQQTLINNTGNTQSANISLQINDNIGCNDNQSQLILINPQRLEGYLDFGEEQICSGNPWSIDYIFTNADPPSSYIIHWFPFDYVENNPTVTNNNNNILYTGQYYAQISDNNGCLYQSEFTNICFLNTPNAFISGNDNYCNDDMIRLFGQTGDYEYTWEGLGTDTYYTPNITLPTNSLTPGSYNIDLTVTNGICSSATQRTIVIHPTPPAPAISLSENSCLHDPPVHLHSVYGQPLFWSTGQYVNQTSTFNAGYHSAYYLDENTGCKSEYAYEFVPKPPDFNELMTGCFEFCKQELPKWILGPMGYFDEWNWVINSSYDIDYGNGQIPELIIPEFGYYNLRVAYPTGCVTTSDDLVINQKEYCDSCDILIEARKIKCRRNHCEIIISAHIIIINLSMYPTTLNEIVSPGIELLSPNLPLTIAPGASANVMLHFVLNYYEPQVINTEFLFEQGDENCIYHWNIDLSEVLANCIDHDCEVEFEEATFNHDLSSGSMQYYNFALSIDSNQENVQVFSDECQIINYDYNYSTGLIYGIFAITSVQLQNMIDNHEDICFSVYSCWHNSICNAYTCFHAEDLDPGLKNTDSGKISNQQNLNTGECFTENYKLYPNPTKDVFIISGGDNDIVSVSIIDLLGRIILSENKREISIADLRPGKYIVKIVNSNNKVQFLKIIKQ